jgi:hypothetical protein
MKEVFPRVLLYKNGISLVFNKLWTVILVSFQKKRRVEEDFTCALFLPSPKA